MTKFALAAVAALVPISTLQAVPVDCTTLASNLAAYITQSAAGGCFVQDKLFTNFSYTGGGAVAAANVAVDPVFTVLPGQEIHGFTFTTGAGIPVWVTGFTLAYTIQVDPPGVTQRIVSAKTQGNFGNVPPNPAMIVDTLGNGVVQTVSLGGGETDIDSFAPVASLSVSNAATIPTGGFLISLENTFTQVDTAIPEPATNILIGSVLLGLAAFMRKRRTV